MSILICNTSAGKIKNYLFLIYIQTKIFLTFKKNGFGDNLKSLFLKALFLAKRGGVCRGHILGQKLSKFFQRWGARPLQYFSATILP